MQEPRGSSPEHSLLNYCQGLVIAPLPAPGTGAPTRSGFLHKHISAEFLSELSQEYLVRALARAYRRTALSNDLGEKLRMGWGGGKVTREGNLKGKPEGGLPNSPLSLLFFQGRGPKTGVYNPPPPGQLCEQGGSIDIAREHVSPENRSQAAN